MPEASISMTRSRLVSGSQIKGVQLRPLTRHSDSRGSFTEVFQSGWDTCIEPVQWSLVSSSSVTFRGFHLHLAHDEYFSCIHGRAMIGLVDFRPALSATDDQAPGIDDLPWAIYELSGDDLAALTFPAGLLHGWYFPVDSEHIQAVSESYADYHSYDNHGVAWNDPELPFDWDLSHCIVSDRAGEFGTAKALIEKLQELQSTSNSG